MHTVFAGSRVCARSAGRRECRELTAVDRTALQLVVDRDVRGSRRRCGQRVDVFGPGVDDGGEFVDIGEIPECLHPPAERHMHLW